MVRKIQMLFALKHFKTDWMPAQVLENLFLGSVGAAMSKKTLQELGVTHILTVANRMNPLFPDDFVYKTIEIPDSAEASLLTVLPECLAFLHEHCQSTKVLVHW